VISGRLCLHQDTWGAKLRLITFVSHALREFVLQLQYRDQRLLEAIAQQAQRKAAILTPQDISQLASAYARLSYQHPELLQLLQGQATAKAADFQPWVLVHTAWALHTSGQDVSQLLNVAVPLLRDAQQLQKLQALDLSSLLWLLAGSGAHAAVLQ